jgi:hypothetical protein
MFGAMARVAPARPATRPTTTFSRGICNFVFSTEIIKADRARLFQVGAFDAGTQAGRRSIFLFSPTAAIFSQEAHESSLNPFG